MIGALISGVSNLANSGISSYIQNKMLDKQIAYQEDAQRLQNEAQMQITREYNQAQQQLAKSQNDYNTQMWHMENDYNSPTATMKRLTDAGINPRAYQQIGQFANAGSPAPAVTPEQKMREYTEPKLSSAELRMKRLDIYNATQERKLKALQLTSDTIMAERKLQETKRHGLAVESESLRHNRFTEEQAYIKLEADLLNDYGIRVYKPQGIGSTVDDQAVIGVDIPQWMYSLPKEKAEKLLKKIDEEIKVLKHGNPWRAGFTILDAIAKKLGVTINL